MAKAIFKAIDWYVHLAMLVSIGLGIAAFCVEPPAVIDGSVLALIAEITGAAAILTFLTKLPEYIAAGATARIQRGNTSIEVRGKRKQGRDMEPEEDPLDRLEQEETP